MEQIVVDLILRRLEELEVQIKPLENEYKTLAEFLMKDKEHMRVCTRCGKEDLERYFNGHVCWECINNDIKKPKAAKKVEVKTKSIDEVLKAAREAGMKHLKY